jgi:hypothetical protein
LQILDTCHVYDPILWCTNTCKEIYISAWSVEWIGCAIKAENEDGVCARGVPGGSNFNVKSLVLAVKAIGDGVAILRRRSD